MLQTECQKYLQQLGWKGGGDGVSRALFLKHSVLHFHQELHKGHCDILLGV